MRALVFLFAELNAAAAPAQAPGGLVGRYVADVSEAPPELQLASTLELRPDCTFEWRFSDRDLALAARGTWHSDGGDYLNLVNEQQVGYPGVELARTAQDAGEGVLVALEPDSAAMANALLVEGEYADGSSELHDLRDGRVRFASNAGRRLVTVRIVSEGYSLRSEPFPVPDGRNVLGFRLVPNDFGQALFASQGTQVHDSTVLIEWVGYAIRYARVGPAPARREDDCRWQGWSPEELAAAGPVQPWALSGNEPSFGILDLRLDEPVATTRARSSLAPPLPDEDGFAAGVAELRVRVGERERSFGRVSGLSWSVADLGRGPQLMAVNFAAQDRMLGLGEALARARALQDWLAGAGFDVAVRDGPARFELVHMARAGERVDGWDEAARRLAEEDAELVGMYLFEVVRGPWRAQATLVNAAVRDAMAVVAGAEWMLEVRLARDPPPRTGDPE